MKNIEPNKLALQMIDFQKSAINNSFSALVMIQDQAEKMTESLMSNNQVIPAEGKKLIGEWSLAFKNGQDEFKKAIDDNFKKLETFFSGPEAPQKAAKAKPKAKEAAPKSE